MRRLLLVPALLTGLFVAEAVPAQAIVHHVRRHRVVRRTTYVRPQSRVIVHRRSFKKSAAIVGGSAAGGALIGGLAGGGKGAAIGALAGGGAGLLYDRATHKKKMVVPE